MTEKQTLKDKAETTYNIHYSGMSVSPNLTRDGFFKEKWIKEEDVKQFIKDLKEELRKKFYYRFRNYTTNRTTLRKVQDDIDVIIDKLSGFEEGEGK